MNRTKPIGVRFDPEKLEFIKGREKLKSNQQVIDLLVNRYWWEHKMPVPTHKEAPPLHLKEQEVQTRQPTIGPLQSPAMNPLLLMQKYWENKRELTGPDDYNAWLIGLKQDNRLNSKQKELIINTNQ